MSPWLQGSGRDRFVVEEEFDVSSAGQIFDFQSYMLSTFSKQSFLQKSNAYEYIGAVQPLQVMPSPGV
eukprot:g28502.t1